MGQPTENAGQTEFKTKLVLVGDCGCGKTTLIKRYVKTSYIEVSFLSRIKKGGWGWGWEERLERQCPKSKVLGWNFKINRIEIFVYIWTIVPI